MNRDGVWFPLGSCEGVNWKVTAVPPFLRGDEIETVFVTVNAGAPQTSMLRQPNRRSPARNRKGDLGLSRIPLPINTHRLTDI